MAIRLISTDLTGPCSRNLKIRRCRCACKTSSANFRRPARHGSSTTGRDLSSLLETTGRARSDGQAGFCGNRRAGNLPPARIRVCGGPAVERASRQAHAELFSPRALGDVPRAAANGSKARGTRRQFYEDIYSPFCFIAESNEEAEAIHEYLDNLLPGRAQTWPWCAMTLYARLSHEALSTRARRRLAEIARQLGIDASETRSPVGRSFE